MNEKAYMVLTYPIPSKKSRIGGVVDMTSDIMKNTGYGDDSIRSVAMCISDALANAIIHGNRQDVKKEVNFVLELYNDRIEIQVTDEGTRYFNPDKVVENMRKTIRDSANGEVSEKRGKYRTNGRGLYIMNELMDDFKITHVRKKGKKIGTRVRMTYGRKD